MQTRKNTTTLSCYLKCALNTNKNPKYINLSDRESLAANEEVVCEEITYLYSDKNILLSP